MATQFTELTPEQVTQLRGNARQTGEYKRVVQEFVDSGLAGVDVTNTFEGRKAGSVTQALKKVVKRDHEGVVDVLFVNDTIALVRV